MIVWLLLFGLAVFSISVSAYAVNNRKRLKALEETLKEQIATINHEIATVSSGAMGVGQHLIHVERKLNDTISQQELLRAATECPSFIQAEKMADEGLEMTQLTERFGLSESEAQLMSLLRSRSHSNTQNS